MLLRSKFFYESLHTFSWISNFVRRQMDVCHCYHMEYKFIVLYEISVNFFPLLIDSRLSASENWPGESETLEQSLGRGFKA